MSSVRGTGILTETYPGFCARRCP